MPWELAPPVQGRTDRIAEQNLGSTAASSGRTNPSVQQTVRPFVGSVGVSVCLCFRPSCGQRLPICCARACTRDTRLSHKSVIRHNKLPSAVAALGSPPRSRSLFLRLGAQLRPLLRPASATWPTRPIPTVVLAQTSAGIRTTLARVRRQCFRHGWVCLMEDVIICAYPGLLRL